MGGVDGGAGFAGEQGGVADEEGGVGGMEHGDGVGDVLEIGGGGVVEVLEEDAGVGGGGAAGGVGCERVDVVEGSVNGKVGGVLDEEEDAADLFERGDGAAGHDSERGRESGDGDEAEVGGAGEEFGGAERGQGVVDVVAGAKVCGGGLVLEVVEQRRWVEERDGRDAERHDFILGAWRCGAGR